MFKISGKYAIWKGQSVVELLLAIALTSLLIPVLLTGFVTSRAGRPQQEQRSEATFLLKEAQEATRQVRDKDWTLFAVDGTYHPFASSSAYVLLSGPETINGYTRQIVIVDVNRDSSGSISASGTFDPSTKKITATVSWITPYPSSVSQTFYLTRFANQNYTETTAADFNAGTKTGVIVTNTSGGEVKLAPGGPGKGNWCDPSHSVVATYNLSGQGITTAISATPGHAFTTTGGNSSGHSMDSIDISDPPYPASPSASNESFYDNFKTYALYADSSYVYLTSDHPGLSVDIVQITSNPYSSVDSLDASYK